MFFASGALSHERTGLSEKIYKSLNANKPELLEQAFISFFAGIPHQWYVKNSIAEYEGYYCSVFSNSRLWLKSPKIESSEFMVS